MTRACVLLLLIIASACSLPLHEIAEFDASLEDAHVFHRAARDRDALKALASDRSIRTWYEFMTGSANCYGRALANADHPCSQLDEQSKNKLIFGFMGCLLDEMGRSSARCSSLKECFGGSLDNNAPVTVLLHVRGIAYNAVVGNFTALCLFNEVAANNQHMRHVTDKLLLDQQMTHQLLERERDKSDHQVDLILEWSANYSALQRQHAELLLEWSALQLKYSDLNVTYTKCKDDSASWLTVRALANHVRRLADVVRIADYSGYLTTSLSGLLAILPPFVTNLLPAQPFNWLIVQLTHNNSSDTYVLAVFGAAVFALYMLIRCALRLFRA